MAFFVPYSLWVAFVQDAIRQVMVIAPFLLIIISAGVLYGFTHYLKDKKQGAVMFLAVASVFIITLAVDSLKIVSSNRNEEPPSVSTINYVTRNYDKNDTKFYCLNDWRLFKYYAPEWCDKKNSHVYFVSTMSGVMRDLNRLKRKPKQVFVGFFYPLFFVDCVRTGRNPADYGACPFLPDDYQRRVNVRVHSLFERQETRFPGIPCRSCCICYYASR